VPEGFVFTKRAVIVGSNVFIGIAHVV